MFQATTFILIITVFALGVRHGFDLDHIATIDAMTRNTEENNRVRNWVGFLFSLGHGLVVILISIFIASGLLQSVIPDWLDDLGQWISVFFLLLFGLITLWNIRPGNKNPTLFYGPKSLLFKPFLNHINHPFFILMIGALFALSFDTISQVALFSLSASKMAGWIFSMMIGVVFMAGMMLSDGLNGLLVAKLVTHAADKSIFLARILGLLIAALSLTLGVMGALQFGS